MVYNWLKNSLHQLFPVRCRLCKAPAPPGLALCDGCRTDLPWLGHSCTRCAMPLPACTNTEICPACCKTPPALDRCDALFAYLPPVDQWIQQLKFDQDLAAARLLGRLLAQQMPIADSASPSLLLPVPLHRKRLRQRGYNQALEIARPLKPLGYPVEHTACRRSRSTAAQSDLPSERRRANIRGAFAIHGDVQGKRFILIDDVMTTGATLNELAASLKKAGAAWVEARVVARTLDRKHS